MVAALESVDHVFLFSERRNAQNLELLRPDVYIKAGDYEKSGLTSAEVGALIDRGAVATAD